MTPERQKKIDDLHRRSNRVLEIVMGALLLLGATVLLKPLLAALGFDMEDYAWFAIIKAIYKYTGVILGILTILAICTTGVLSYLATDEEKKQRKEEIKEAWQEIKAEESANPKRTIFEPDEIKIPLKGLTPQQIAVVHKILQRIPEQNGHLKTAELVQILRALKGQGDLDDSNMQVVIDWVEYVTEKQVDVRNFKYDYESKYSEKGVNKWGDIIRAEFDRIEIS